MTLRTTLSLIRFGTGLSPHQRSAAVEELIDEISGADVMADRFPQESLSSRVEAAIVLQQMHRETRDDSRQRQAYFEARRVFLAGIQRQFGIELARGIGSPFGFRDRLTWFWADHFTTRGQRRFMETSISAYVNEAIRPHVGGSFPDMLEAAILHPVMVLYLDQDLSYGPNSRTGLNRNRSLNENLARELIELHTMGVSAPYTQYDVRQMAELLTGLGVTNRGELVFRPANAEPGAEFILGERFGGPGTDHMDEIRRALRALALRPETARHLATKLVDHFITDDPDQSQVEQMADAYLDSGGHLGNMVEVMLAHPAAWSDPPGRVKSPIHYLASSLRALDVDPNVIVDAAPRDLRRYGMAPMAAMGQNWQGAAGPDGYFDDDREWIRPQALAARIGWAMTVPSRLMGRLPDPRDFVETALADHAGEALQWAAARAATRADGIGLILTSPEFQRG